MVMERALGRSLPDIEVVSSNAAKAIRNEKFMLHLQQEGRSANAGRAYFFSPAVKLVTMVTDWLTCCVTQSRRNFLPSGKTSYCACGEDQFVTSFWVAPNCDTPPAWATATLTRLKLPSR